MHLFLLQTQIIDRCKWYPHNKYCPTQLVWKIDPFRHLPFKNCHKNSPTSVHTFFPILFHLLIHHPLFPRLFNNRLNIVHSIDSLICIPLFIAFLHHLITCKKYQNPSFNAFQLIQYALANLTHHTIIIPILVGKHNLFSIYRLNNITTNLTIF